MATPADRTVKVVLIGDSGVGKSCICNRFITGHFNSVEATIGAAFFTQTMETDNSTVKFQVWDTAGQERYRSLVSMYYRGTKAAILVYDISDVKTFEGVQKWTEEIRDKGEGNIVIVLCGNKADLNHAREVKPGDARWFAKHNGLQYIETSAKTGLNIHNLFELIARRLPVAEQRVQRARLEACRIQMQILDLETSLQKRRDPALEARLAFAKEKLEKTGRTKDVINRGSAALARLMSETNKALGQTTDVKLHRTNVPRKDPPACC